MKVKRLLFKFLFIDLNGDLSNLKIGILKIKGYENGRFSFLYVLYGGVNLELVRKLMVVVGFC